MLTLPLGIHQYKTDKSTSGNCAMGILEAEYPVTMIPESGNLLEVIADAFAASENMSNTKLDALLCE